MSGSTATVFKGSKSGNVVKDTVTRTTALGPNDVAISMTHSGVCFTDLHHIHDDMVLGHEGVGVVEAIGDSVKNFKVGERVGFGYVRGGCGHCEECAAGRHFYCAESRQYGVNDLDQGSFATKAVWPETLLHKIPDSIDSLDAGPFMCAGQTVFVPLMRHEPKPGDRIGIVGIGGLGHLAIQFASKIGAEVVVFSSSEKKRREAEQLGANEFWVIDDLKSGAKKIGKGIDHLLVTAAGHPDWDLFLDLMAPFGHVHLLTVTPERLNMPFLPILLKELNLHGSCSSTPAEVEKMLHFAAIHKIKPIREVFPMTEDGVKEAIRKLQTGEIRYRGILEVQA